MGSSQSTPNAYGVDAALMKYYGSVILKMKAKPTGITGGCDCNPITGAGDLQNYESSIYSKAKEKLIRKIAAVVFKALGKKVPVNPDKSPIESVVGELTKAVPKAKEGFGIVAKKKIHDDVMADLVRGINDAYGTEIIDTNSPASEQADKIHEVIYSLIRDVNSEFMTVAGDIERSVVNLKTLKEYLEATHKRIMEEIGKAGDDIARQQAEAIDSFYQMLLVELDRQLAILANTVDAVVGPTRKDLLSLLEDNESFKGMVEKLKAATGTNEFGTKLGYMFSGVDVLANAAHRVNKALKAIGMSVKEYKDSKNMAELREKMYAHMAKGKGPVSTQDMATFIAATEILRNAEYAHDEIAKALEKKGGEIAASIDASQDAYVEGGAELFSTRISTDKSLGKRLEKQDKFRERLFADFYDNLLTSYRAIVKAVDTMAPKIGKSIPISDELDRFIRSFSELQMADRENFHVVLSGWQRDAQSRDLKNGFMMALETCHNHLQALLKTGKGSSELRDIDSAIGNLRTLVTTFNTKFLSAVTEVALPKPSTITGKGEDGNVDMDMPDEKDIVGGHLEISDETSAKLKELLRTAVTGSAEPSEYYVSIKTAQRKLSYFYHLATLDGDLKQAAENIKEYGKDYELLLGESIAPLVDQVERKYDEELKDINSWETAEKAGSLGRILRDFYEFKNGVDGNVGALTVSNTNDDEKKARKEQISKWVEIAKKYYTQKRDAKKNLYKVAQSIDLYLRAFAATHAAHSDEIKDVAAIFDSVQLTAKSFTERSGDNLAALFEEFPADLLDDYDILSNRHIDVAGDLKEICPPYKPSDEHYYEYIGRIMNGGQLPGNPFYGRLLFTTADYDKLTKQVQKSVAGIRALENLVSAFFSAGSKFTGKSLEKESFMNAGQVFKTLMEYWSTSALVMGAKGEDLKKVDVTDEKYVKVPVAKTYTQWNAADATVANTTNALNKLAAERDALKPVTVPTAGAVAFVPDAKPISAVSGYPKIDTAKATFSRVRAKLAFGMSSAISVDTAFNDPYKETDEIFLMIIKSMGAKILVLTETFALLHKPSTRAWSLSPFRTILGGKEGGDVEIVDEFAELYVRLPLMGEWYREKLTYSSLTPAEKNREFVISIIPDDTSVHADFMGLMFDRTAFIKEGTYSEGDIRALIRAINKMGYAYKDKDPNVTTRNVIRGFVTEVNRRYGFIRREDMDKYYESRRRTLESVEGTDPNEDQRVDYDITDSRNAYGSRPAPSDQFTSFRSYDPKVQQVWTKEVKTIVEDFRKKIFEDIQEVEMQERKDGRITHSFTEAIRNVRESLKSIKSPADKFQLVLRSMQGLSKFGGFRMEQALIFQELVVFPLTTLYSLWRILAEFNMFVHSTDMAKFEEMPATVRASIAGEYAKLKKTEVTNLAGSKASNYFVNAASLTAFVRGDLNGAAGAHTEVQYRTAFNLSDLFREIIRNCYVVGADLGKLCEFNITADGSIVLDVTSLRDHVVRVLSGVKKVIDKFGDIYGRSFVEQFEKYSNASTLSTVTSSYYDMEEHLLEILLKDRDKTGIPRASEVLTSTLKMIRKNADPVELGDIMDGRVFWDVAYAPDSATEDRSANMMNFPFSIIPQYDNNAGGMARSEDEKAVIRSLADVKGDIETKVQLALHSKWKTDLVGILADSDTTLVLLTPFTNGALAALTGLDSGAMAADLDLLKHFIDAAKAAKAPLEDLYKRVAAFRDQVVPLLSASLGKPMQILEQYILEGVATLRGAVTLVIARATDGGGGGGGDAADAYAAAGVLPFPLDGFVGDVHDADQIRAYLQSPAYMSLLMPETGNANENAYMASIDGHEGPFERHLAEVADTFGPLTTQGINRFNTTEPLVRTIDGSFRELAAKIDLEIAADQRKDAVLDQTRQKILGQYKDTVSVTNKVIPQMIVGEVVDFSDDKYGLLVRFNQLLARYLAMFYDSASRAFYTPLIEGFARSVSSAVMNGQALADLDIPSDLKQVTPKQGVIIFASVARAMRNLLTSANPTTNVKLYAKDKLGDISDYMRENMKGNLPWFIKYFNDLRQSAEYLKKFVTDANLQFMGAAGIGAAFGAKPGLSINYEVRVAADKKSLYLSILDGLVSASNAIVGSASAVYRELVDVPLYFETYTNSIAQLKSQNGRLPIMPMNYMIHPLSAGYSATVKVGLLAPGSKSGSDVFKFNYGTRKLLTDVREPFKMSFAPGFDSAVESFNGISASHLKLEKSDVEQEMRDTLALLQWVLSNRSSKIWLVGSGMASIRTVLPAAQLTSFASAKRQGYPMFAISKDANGATPTSLNELVSTIESGDVRRVAELTLSGTVPGANKLSAGDRKLWQKYNILDLNIVPINPHALMRDVPLINLMNYSGAFSEMIDRFLRSAWRDSASYKGQVVYPEDVVVGLIREPHKKLDGMEYYGLLQRAAVGDLSVPAQRPRIISDQLWNKALLNEQYTIYGSRNTVYATGVERGAEDDAKGWLVDVHGPMGDSIMQRGINTTTLPTTAYDAAGVNDDGAAIVTGAAGRRPEGRKTLTYPAINKTNKRYVEKAVQLGDARDANHNEGREKPLALAIGRLRADTSLVRNMLLTTLSQFILRLMVTSKLERIHTPVIQGREAVDPRFTEYRGAEQFDIEDFQ
jgi:hypothetical protein